MFNRSKVNFMRLRHLAMISALIMVTSCNSIDGLMSNVSTVGQVSSNYRENAYPIAGLNRDMWVIVTGAVPGSDTPALQQQTLAAMQRHAGINTHFTATPQNHNQEYKTVMLFNGPGTVNGDALCRNPVPQSAATPAQGNDLRLQAVFCRYDRYLTEVIGHAGGTNSLNNPNFNALIRQTMTEMYRAPRVQQRNEPDEG